ncbi:hypothetical protein BGW38_010605 [Lunasporangiospora selenospora]|uniref:Uncharacterized protein n=1 Tax=Lunasporangiospora selenospora TaxID=979761 RepID=A0A9P6FWU1_9FUNG|nr:hypothetical protein BGW38_010605 [Lunasporangiospora selenospora]
MSSLEDSIVANNLAGTSMQSSLVTQSIVPSDPTVTLQGNNKDYLNCFDQWMSDLGKGDGSAASTQDGQGLGEQSFAAATIATASTANPTISPATTSLPVGALAAAIHSNLTSQYVPLPVLDDDDGDFEAPNIDHLLYSDLGEDYGPFTGYGSSVGTPASELERYDLHSDAVSTDIYDWFPDVRSHHGATDQGGHPASDLSVGAPSSFADPSSSPFIPHRHSLDPDSRHRSLDYRQLSHLSTDPILSSSPGELSQGLDMGLEFEPTADPLWLQQELLLQQQHQQHQQQQQQQQQHQQHQQYQRQHQQHQQHQRQQHNVQQSLQGSSGLGLSPNPHHLMDTPLLESLSSSRGGTPQLSSSGGSSLLSSALSEMLSPSAILAQASYLPMGLGSQLDEEACSNSGGESRPFAKEQGNVRVAGTGVDFMLRTSI